MSLGKMQNGKSKMWIKHVFTYLCCIVVSYIYFENDAYVAESQIYPFHSIWLNGLNHKMKMDGKTKIDADICWHHIHFPMLLANFGIHLYMYINNQNVDAFKSFVSSFYDFVDFLKIII